MERVIIFKNTETGEELVMPVTPASYQIEHGRKQNTETLYLAGDVTSPGPAVLIDEEPEFLLPAHDYPFNQPGAILNPFVYLEKLEKWSDAGTVLRYVVADTPVNAAVRLGPIRYREEDGTNDVLCVVPIRGVRQLEAEEAEAANRAAEADPVKASTYTVVQGDTLGGICRKFYGDANLAAALAARNGIQNVNLIHPGQVLSIPDRSALPASAAAGNGRVMGKSQAAAARISVISYGPSHFYGNLMVAYIKENGVADSKLAGKSDSGVSVQAKRGTQVNLALAPNNKGRVAYFTLDGKTVGGGGGAMAVTADTDHKIVVNWGRPA